MGKLLTLQHIKIMQIYVDADECPKVIKEVLFRAAERLQIPLTLVAAGDLVITADLQSARLSGVCEAAV